MSPEDSSLPRVRLRGARGHSRHPWIYRRMLRGTPRGVRDGDEVLVVSATNEPIGRGFYHGSSTIAVRLMTRDPAERLDRRFLRGRLEAAIALRRDRLDLDRRSDAYRLVHSEGDGLSGLVVDRYKDVLVAELYSKAFFVRRGTVRELLGELIPEARVLFRIDSLAGRRERMELPESERAPTDLPREVEVVEDKVRYLVDLSGHKTGFFLDQRDNRARLAKLARGLRFLDAFAYTGAFGIALATVGKARRVVSVDLDEEAVRQGRRNARLNRAEIEWVHEDVFRYLRNQAHATDPFDVICLDPPKWATARDRVDEAESRYLDVNTYAIRAIARGGILLTCSCSGLISEERFLRILQRAASRAGRRLQLIQVAGAAADHPVDIDCPESRYLKAVFAWVP